MLEVGGIGHGILSPASWGRQHLSRQDTAVRTWHLAETPSYAPLLIRLIPAVPAPPTSSSPGHLGSSEKRSFVWLAGVLPTAAVSTRLPSRECQPRPTSPGLRDRPRVPGRRPEGLVSSSHPATDASFPSGLSVPIVPLWDWTDSIHVLTMCQAPGGLWGPGNGGDHTQEALTASWGHRHGSDGESPMLNVKVNGGLEKSRLVPRWQSRRAAWRQWPLSGASK